MFSRKIEMMNRWIARLCVCIFGTMVAVVFLQVVLRYLFHFGFPWVEESARYLQIWLTFLGACLAFEKFSHVYISFFVDRLPAALRVSVFLLVQLTIVAFLLLLVYKGLSLAKFGWAMRSAGMGVPMSAIYLAIPFCAVIMCLNVFDNAIRTMKDYIGKR